MLRYSIGFFSIPILIVLSSCSFLKYNSMSQAEKACKEWADKGFTYSYEYLPLSSDVLFPWEKKKPGPWDNKPKKQELMKGIGNKRWCVKEKETNQFLGYEKFGVKKQHYKLNEYKQLKTKIEIKKNFRY